jgi:hypothetical protein
MQERAAWSLTACAIVDAGQSGNARRQDNVIAYWPSARVAMG